MHDLLKTALLGTAKLSSATLPEVDAAASLAVRLDGEPLERKLLLASGACAVYSDAGVMPATAEAPAVAEPEALPACPLKAAALLRHMFANAPGLLPEALERLGRAGLRLPADLLPLALQKTPRDLRGQLVPVLGARGRWLAQFNPQWKWVQTTLSTSAERPDEIAPELETAWQEGSISQRKEALARVRRIDAARGRAWLEAAWASEKAEHRVALLEAMSDGLSADDLPFLEQSLADRSGKVKAQALELLSLLPESALGSRMRERGEGMLELAAPKGGLKKVASLLSGKGARLKITPPADLPKQWEQDGIAAKPPQGIGQRAFWMTQVMALVPPSHWESQFGASPAELVHAGAEDEFGASLMQAWSRAAVRFRLPIWIEALWDYWSAQKSATARSANDAPREEMMKLLLQGMDPAVLESRAVSLLNSPEPADGFNWVEALQILSRPWPLAVGRAYAAGLSGVRAQLLQRASDRVHVWRWVQSFPLAAAALPLEVLREALGQLQLTEGEEQHDPYVWSQLRHLAEVVQTRLELADAVPI